MGRRAAWQPPPRVRSGLAAQAAPAPPPAAHAGRPPQPRLAARLSFAGPWVPAGACVCPEQALAPVSSVPSCPCVLTSSTGSGDIPRAGRRASQRPRHPPWPGAVTVERAVSPHLPSPPWFPESSSTVSFPDTRGTASLGASALWEQKGPRGPTFPLSRCSPCRGSPCPGSPTGPGRAAWRCCATGELGAPSP